MKTPIQWLQFGYDQMLMEYERVLMIDYANKSNVKHVEKFNAERSETLQIIYARMTEYKNAIEFLKLTENNYINENLKQSENEKK